MAQAEVLEPFQDKQETGPLPVRQATELRKILSPTPAAFGRTRRTHDKTQENGALASRQTKSVLSNIFRLGRQKSTFCGRTITMGKYPDFAGNSNRSGVSAT
jgi:hypothetical protein